MVMYTSPLLPNPMLLPKASRTSPGPEVVVTHCGPGAPPPGPADGPRPRGSGASPLRFEWHPVDIARVINLTLLACCVSL